MSQNFVVVMLGAYLLVQTCQLNVQAMPTEVPAVAPVPSETISTASAKTKSSADLNKLTTESIPTEDTLNTFDRESLRLDNYTVVQGKNILSSVLQHAGAATSAALQARLDEIAAFVANVERYLHAPSVDVAGELFDLMREFIAIGDNFDLTARSHPDDAEIVRFKNLMAEQLDQLVDAIIDGGLREFGAGVDL